MQCFVSRRGKYFIGFHLKLLLHVLYIVHGIQILYIVFFKRYLKYFSIKDYFRKNFFFFKYTKKRNTFFIYFIYFNRYTYSYCFIKKNSTLLSYTQKQIYKKKTISSQTDGSEHINGKKMQEKIDRKSLIENMAINLLDNGLGNPRLVFYFVYINKMI